MRKLLITISFILITSLAQAQSCRYEPDRCLKLTKEQRISLAKELSDISNKYGIKLNGMVDNWPWIVKSDETVELVISNDNHIAEIQTKTEKPEKK